MDTIEAIRARISTRVYQEKAIDADLLSKAVELASRAEPFWNQARHRIAVVDDADLSFSLFKGLAGSYGRLVSAPACLVSIARDSRQDRISAGFAQEQAVIGLTSLGLGSCWVAGEMFYDRARLGKLFGVQDFEKVTNIIAFGWPKRHYFNNAVRSLVGARSRKPKSEIAFFCQWGQPADDFLVNNKNIDLAVEMAILSPSASNRQPVRIVLGDNCAHFYIIDRNDLYSRYRLLDAGIFMSHFHMALDHCNVAHSMSFESAFPACNPGFAYAGTIRWQ